MKKNRLSFNILMLQGLIRNQTVKVSQYYFILILECYQGILFLIYFYSDKAAINPFVKAIDLFAERGRFHTAAKHSKDLAELYEEQLNMPEKAIYYYQRAADWYQGEDSTA